MDYTLLDTLTIYERIIAEKNVEEKRRLFTQELIAPFDALFAIFGISRAANEPGAMEMLRRWNFVMPEAIDECVLDPLAVLVENDAQDRARRTLEEVDARFAGRWNRIPLRHVLAGIFLMDNGRMDPVDRGYTGIGARPGYVMLLYSDPNPYNMARIEATLAHELHHNIRLALFPWRNMDDLTVADHIVTEGRAGACATELYGEEKICYYVTDVPAEDLPRVKAAIGSALGVRGFMQTRAYVYGDRAGAFGGEKNGLPNFAGMAIGYHLVKSYLETTGTSIVDATFVPSEEIVRESGDCE